MAAFYGQMRKSVLSGQKTMKINVGTTERASSANWENVVAVVVLTAELLAVVQLTRIHVWFANTVRSDVLRIALYVASFLTFSIWGLAIWPRVHGATGWMIWIVGFGATGVFFSYLSFARNFGRGFSVIYGPIFLAQAMIGVAGLARLIFDLATQKRANNV